MKTQQMLSLNQTGLECLKKAELCSTSKEVQAFTELGLKCLAEARAILDENKRSSALVFVECCLLLNRAPGPYPAYLEFCTRNNLERLAKADFEALAEALAEE